MDSIKALMSLRGRTALVTGAAGNLGSTMSGALAELGATLILVDLPGSSLGALAERMRSQYGVHVTERYADLEDPLHRAELIQWVNESNKQLNVLLNNAAFVGTSDLEGWAVAFEDQRLDTWRRAFEVNLTAVFDLVKGLKSLMECSVGANIVNIASIYGAFGPDSSLYEGTTMNNPAAYGASKGGLIQLTRWMSTNLAPKIRVNAISPGGVLRGQPEVFVERYSKRTPMKRMATEADFIGAITYLATDLSGYVTGQNLAVDGGWGVW